MGRVTRKEWYRRVNEAWPKPLPQLTEEEAARAARRLYRFVRKTKFAGKVLPTSGNRFTDIRYGDMYVNAERGWDSLVHELSHELINAPHGGEHARLELRMIKEVLKRGWLSGTLKREPKQEAVVDVRRVRAERVAASIARWEKKLARAETALKKLRRKARYYSAALDLTDKEEEPKE